MIDRARMAVLCPPRWASSVRVMTVFAAGMALAGGLLLGRYASSLMLDAFSVLVLAADALVLRFDILAAAGVVVVGVLLDFARALPLAGYIPATATLLAVALCAIIYTS